jgi:integrase
MGTEVVKPAAIKAIVERAQVASRLGEGKACAYRIEGERGLWLRVSAGGTAAWSFVYRVKGSARVQRYGLGHYPDVTVKVARDAASKWRGLVGGGEDPREMIRQRREEEEAKKARITVADAVERYLESRANKRTVSWMRQLLKVNLVKHHGALPVADFTRAQFDAIRDRIKKDHPTSADMVGKFICSLLYWCKRQEHVTDNVAAGFERALAKGEGVRERKWTAREVNALWLLLDQPGIGVSVAMRRIIRLGLLLGQRANEIAGMRRSELSADLRFWTIPKERMKAGHIHILPLPPMARAIIDEALAETTGALLFPRRLQKGQFPTTMISQAMAQLQKHLQLKDADGEPDPAKFHDFRRTLAVGVQQRGASIDVVKAILAHSNSADMTRERYAQSDLCRDVIKALTRWQADVGAMVCGDDPLAFDARDADAIEREILGDGLTIPTGAALAPNVVPLRRATDVAPRPRRAGRGGLDAA